MGEADKLGPLTGKEVVDATALPPAVVKALAASAKAPAKGPEQKAPAAAAAKAPPAKKS